MHKLYSKVRRRLNGYLVQRPWQLLSVGLLSLLFLLTACRDENEDSPTGSFEGALPENARARLGKGSADIAAISPDGQLFAVGGDAGLYIYDLATLAEVLNKPSISPVNVMSFTPDSQILAAGTKNGSLSLLELSSGDVISSLPPSSDQDNGVQSLAWTEQDDGFVLAAGFNDGNVLLSQLIQSARDNDGQGSSVVFKGQLPRERSGVTAVAFSPNTRFLATGNRGGLVNLWDTKNIELIGTLDGHEQGHAVLDLEWSPDGSRLLSGARDGMAIQWDMLTFSPLTSHDQQESEVIRVGYGPDGNQYLSAASTGEITMWDPDEPADQGRSIETTAGLTSIDWTSGWDAFITTHDGKEVKLWESGNGVQEFAAGKNLAGYSMHGQWVTDVAWSPDGQNLAAVLGEEILIWDESFEMPVFSLTEHEDRVTAIAWDPDGSRLATADSMGKLIIWEVPEGKPLTILEDHRNAVTDLEWSPYGRQLASAGSLENRVNIWDTSDGALVNQISGSGEGLWSLAWSPNGDSLATGSTLGPIYLWDLDEFQPAEPYQILARHISWVSGLSWSPDGRSLASASADTLVILWDLDSGSSTIYPGHGAPVRDVAFSPDGSLLASASHDKLVNVWTANPDDSSRLLSTYSGHSSGANAVAWSSDGQTLASGSDDGTVILWEIERQGD